MRKSYVLFLLLLVIPVFADQQKWLEEVSSRTDKKAEEWIKGLLKERISQENKKTIELPIGNRKCVKSFSGFGEKPSLYVFTSFSVPEPVWLQLSHEVRHLGGVFVLKGLPKNSFKGLSKRCLRLKKRGLEAAVQINPDLFEKYQIDKVPAFVVSEENSFDKIAGSVSLEFALQKMSEKGNTILAKKLNEKLRIKN